MKKKFVLILATLMCVSLCACGGAESTSANNTDTKTEESTSASSTETQALDSGFVPVATEKPTETEGNEQTIEEAIDESNLEKYYDVTEFIGTPRLETVTIPRPVGKDKEKETLTVIYSKYVIIEPGNEWDVRNEYEIVKNDAIKVACSYYAILTDNNTPDDYSDDLLAYIFTTPVEE